MNRINRSTVLGTGALMLLALVVVSFSCGGGDGSPDGEPPLVLRSYQITPELAPELSTILNDVLDRGEDLAPAGRVNLGPSGQLIVAAPEPLHKGIEQIIADMENTAPEPAPMITLTYWIVAGSPADTTEWSPRLAELEPALQGVASAEGPTRFTLLEKVQLHSLSGETGNTRAHLFWIRQKATAREGKVFAYLHLRQDRLGSGGFETRVSLRPDQLLVLGQTALPERLRGDEDAGSVLYVLVRPQIDETTSR